MPAALLGLIVLSHYLFISPLLLTDVKLYLGDLLFLLVGHFGFWANHKKLEFFFSFFTTFLHIFAFFFCRELSKFSVKVNILVLKIEIS